MDIHVILRGVHLPWKSHMSVYTCAFGTKLRARPTQQGMNSAPVGALYPFLSE